MAKADLGEPYRGSPNQTQKQRIAESERRPRGGRMGEKSSPLGPVESVELELDQRIDARGRPENLRNCTVCEDAIAETDQREIEEDEREDLPQPYNRLILVNVLDDGPGPRCAAGNMRGSAALSAPPHRGHLH